MELHQRQRCYTADTESDTKDYLNYRPIKYLTLDYKYNINHSREDYIRTSRNQEGNKLSAKNNYSVGEGLTGGIQQIFTRKTNQNSLFTATINTDFEKDFGLNIPIITTTQLAFDWRKQQFNRSYLNFIGLPPFDYNPKNGNIVVNGAQAQVNNASEYEDKFITYGYFVNQRLEYGEVGVFRVVLEPIIHPYLEMPKLRFSSPVEIPTFVYQSLISLKMQFQSLTNSKFGRLTVRRGFNP